MALEQTVKELQAQSAQFQETLLNLAKEQNELMALIAKKKKTRKSVSIFNMGRRFRGPAKQVQTFDIPSDEDENQEEYGKIIKAEKGSNLGSNKIPDEEEEDYSDEQYPPGDEKYKQLEDRLNVMEIQRVYG